MEIYIMPLLYCVRLVSLTSYTREGQRASCLPQGETIPVAKHCTGGDTQPRPSLTFSLFFWALISYTKCLISVKYGPSTVVSGDLPSSIQKVQVWPLRAFNSTRQFSLLHGVFHGFGAAQREEGYHCHIIHTPCFLPINDQEYF